MIEQHYLEHRYYFQEYYWNSDYYLLRMLTMIRHRIIGTVAELIENYNTKSALIEDYNTNANIIEKYGVDIS